MKKALKYYLFSICILLCIPSYTVGQQLKTFHFYDQSVSHAEQKLKQTLIEISYNTSLHPSQTIPETGKWDARSREDWTSGFFAGSMWYLNWITQDLYWEENAQLWTEDLKPMSLNTGDHDMGFRIFSSFGNGYKTHQWRSYQKVILQSAATLAKRYNPEIKAIKSWDWIGNYPVIIDNLLNLELLFWASTNGGIDEWYDIAVHHAETSLEHHMRSDGSTYHIVDFDDYGNVNWKDTRQGYGPNSVWARGQAWAIYGFTMIYRFTENEKFLNAAQSAANYFIENLPDDQIPIYDFLEPEPSVQSKDVSAASITASALFELYTFTNNVAYYNKAVDILTALTQEPYSSINSDDSSILRLSTIHRGMDKRGTSYADYYFLEALVRYGTLNGIIMPQLSQRPEQIYLEQNYPNPFNDSTIVYYSIENEGFVELSIFDINGRKIQTLVNSLHQIGNYQVTINASNLASGLYLYQLKTNQNTLTKKMIVIK